MENSELKNLEELMNEDGYKVCQYKIPIYQRSYNWEKKQIEKLWNDIESIDIKKENKYFFGSIIVSKDSCDKKTC